MMKEQAQPWLGKPWIDTVFILLPPFLSLLVVLLFPGSFQNTKGMPDNWWVILILLIDVGHVYSTLYRTYFNQSALLKQRGIFYLIPLVSFILAVSAYNYSPVLFWRLLAYLAVYHFVRQQYGFMRLYSRKENYPALLRSIDKWVIYYATAYPLIYWHLSGPRNFNWFVAGDFATFESASSLQYFTWLYWVTLIVYAGKECVVTLKYKALNIPKLAIMLGTIVSWYFGIVYFNGDMAFTVLNVVSHGIPYMALIWIYGKKQDQNGENRKLSVFFKRYGLVLFLGLIFLLAYVEEGLWDSVLWKEHQGVFAVFHKMLFHVDGDGLGLLVPLLALPQITHYVIDGFIWKVRKQEERIQI